ncbi:MAG: CYTH domain-containing protein [Candidatus Electrothrix sp. ATG1]|nr:CYTH domain-containing protein [Candidatus Electrothrix sp. ATG1]MCI5208214.1 CYTH domain-containing protein [Candidatus Electrothrix sp. ATG2]
MAKEIERKFLIDISQLGDLKSGVEIKQGYISTTDNTAVRIRLLGDKAFLTLKGENTGATRSEFEYAIPIKDANEMLAEFCSGPIIEKTRYFVVHCDHTWEVDIFHGDNDGLVVAEVEMHSEDENVNIPTWVVKEVTGDPKYYNSNLMKKPFKDWS